MSGSLGFWYVPNGSAPVGDAGVNTGGLSPTTGPYSYKITENWPHQTVEGLPIDLSAVSVTIALGAAYMNGSRLVSLVTMPKTCPAGGLAVKAELSFGAGAQPTWEKVTLTAKEPCPKR